MISKIEFEAYKEIATGDQTKKTLASMNPEAISKIGGKTSVYYARLSGEYAQIKDEIMSEFIALTEPKEDGSKEMPATKADKYAEVAVNGRHEVSRREIEYLMNALDKIAFACSARVRSFNKEGSY